MDLLTRGILGKRLLKTKRITVPELGADVIIRELSAGDALRLSEDPAMKNPVTVAIKSIVDDAGELLFTPAEADELASRIPPSALSRIVAEVVALSGLSGKDDQEKN